MTLNLTAQRPVLADPAWDAFNPPSRSSGLTSSREPSQSLRLNPGSHRAQAHFCPPNTWASLKSVWTCSFTVLASCSGLAPAGPSSAWAGWPRELSALFFLHFCFHPWIPGLPADLGALVKTESPSLARRPPTPSRGARWAGEAWQRAGCDDSHTAQALFP